MQQSYNAIRVAAHGPPSVLQVATLPALVAGPRQVLLRVRAIGVNPVETYQRAGANGYAPTFPYTPGNDCAGVVVAVGEGASRFAPGDAVYTLGTRTGAYAEMAVADEGMVRRLPPGLSFAQGAALPVPYYTAYRALFRRMGVRAGRTILVHGATGGVGIAALQMARAAGLRVIGSAGSDAGAALIAPFCAEVVRHGPGATTAADVLRLTAGVGVHYIFECLANVNLPADLTMLARMAGAVVCVVGNRGEATINARELMTREAALVGVTLFANDEGDWDEAEAYIAAGAALGTLRPVVGTVLRGLESAPAAHEEVIAHVGGARGKVVIEL